MSYRTARSNFLQALRKKGIVSEDQLNLKEGHTGLYNIYDQKYISIFFNQRNSAEVINFYSHSQNIGASYLPLLLSSFLPGHLISANNGATFFQSVTGKQLPNDRRIYSISFIPGSSYGKRQNLPFIDENDDQLMIKITLLDIELGLNDPDAYSSLYYAVLTDGSSSEFRALSQ
jgi:hypothetical protein